MGVLETPHRASSPPATPETCLDGGGGAVSTRLRKAPGLLRRSEVVCSGCGSAPTVVSRGGLARDLLIRLQIREVRILANVGDDRLREKAGEILDQIGGAGGGARRTRERRLGPRR